MVARSAWITGLGIYTIEVGSEPFNQTTGNIRFDVKVRGQINFKSSGSETESEKGSVCGTVVKPAQLLQMSNARLQDFLAVASFANVASIYQKEGKWHSRGDPTEVVIQVFSSRFDWNRLGLTTGDNPKWSDITEFPFGSDVKCMSVIMRQ